MNLREPEPETLLRVPGFLHRPPEPGTDALVLTHGAGSNCRSPLLVMLAKAFAAAGVTVLRFDLPFRQKRPHGPPFPAGAQQDREGLREAVKALRQVLPGRVFLGGHSYGGRQISILAASEPSVVDGLLLLSYPLHPPKRASELRIAHFPDLRTGALFVHGSRDPFGSLEEMRQALNLIPARTELIAMPGAGHDLSNASGLPEAVTGAFRSFFN